VTHSAGRPPPRHSRVKRLGTGLAGALFLILATLLLPLHFVLESAQNEERVPGLLSKERLDVLGKRAIVLELQKRDLVLELRSSPLEMSTIDLQRVVDDTFTPEDFLAKAAETHGALLHYVRHTSPDSIFFISVRREKPILIDSGRARLHAKFDSWKPCGTWSMLGIGWHVMHEKFSDKTELELLRQFPNCRPPDFIASKVHAGVDRRSDAMKTTCPDSVRVLPSRHGSDHPTHRAVVLGLRLADRLLVEGAGLLYCTLVVLLGINLVLRRRDGRMGLRHFATVLVLAGAILVLEGILLRSQMGRPGTLQQLFADPLASMVESRRAWFHIAFYAIENVLTDAGGRIVWVGAVLGVVGIALALATWLRRHGVVTQPAGIPHGLTPAYQPNTA